MDTSNELQPKQQWLEERFENICKAIAARYDLLKPIPVEWIEEYNELTTVVTSSEVEKTFQN